MTIAEIISGLKFTIEMFLFDPSTGEKLTEPRNNMDKITLDACKGAIKALEQEPCEDCISRQAVLEEVLSHKHIVYDDDGIGYSVVRVYEIMALPSVTPKPKIGKWIEKEDYNLDTYYECSECGADYCIEGDILIHKYCPNCGSEMTELKTELEEMDEEECR